MSSYTKPANPTRLGARGLPSGVFAKWANPTDDTIIMVPHVYAAAASNGALVHLNRAGHGNFYGNLDGDWGIYADDAWKLSLDSPSYVLHVYPGVTDVEGGLGPAALTSQTDAGYIQADVRAATAQAAFAALGWLKSGTWAQTFTAASDFAAIYLNFDEVDYQWGMQQKLNGGATTEERASNSSAPVDDTWYTLRMEVSSGGVVTPKVDGTALTGLTPFTFDSGDILLPFVTGGSGSDVDVRNIEVGSL